MIQISKLLTGYYVIAYSAVLKTVDEFVRMREITWSVKGALIFAFYMLNVRHICTSVLFDLLT